MNMESQINPPSTEFRISFSQNSLSNLSLEYQEILQRAIESQHQKKTSLLAKIKNRKTILTPTKPQENMTASDKLLLDLARWKDIKFELSYFSQLVEDLYSNEKIKQYRGLIGIRRFLSVENPNIQTVIDAKLVPKVIEFLRMEDEPEIQIEAGWLLANVASGTTEQLKEVMNKGAVPAFVKILYSKNKELREQAIWAFGNISGDSPRNRDIVLKHGGLLPLLKAIHDPEANNSTVSRGIWALSNMCRGTPLPSLNYTVGAIPTFWWILNSQKDEDILTDAAWALNYLTKNLDKTDFFFISNKDFLEKLTDYLENPSLSISIPCLRIIGNLVGKIQENAQAFLDIPKFLPNLYNLLGHRKRTVQKDAASTLSDFILSSAESIHKLDSNLSFLPKLVRVINQNRETRMQIEVQKAISHLIQTIESQALKSILQEDFLNLFIGAFHYNIDFKYVRSSLETLEVVLKFSATLTSEDSLHLNNILAFIQEKGILDDLIQLQQTPHKSLYTILVQFIMLYIPNVEIIPRSFSSSQSETSENSDSD